MNGSAQLARNAGPSWGFAFLSAAQRRMPGWLLRPALMAGTWVAVARMPEQRRHSRAFLSLVRDRPAGLVDVWRHFFSFLEFLLLRLRAADEGPGPCAIASEDAADFEALMASGAPALFGTFHFGHSDLLGFLLGTRGRRVAMVRLRMGNSPEMERLAQRFGGAVSFIWVNEAGDLLFALKRALDAGDSIAMQCDRTEFSSRTEVFEFFGARRRLPFTIYHLARLFGRPVMFCLGVPDGVGGTRILASTLYRPDAPEPDCDFSRARVHFQGVLTRLERLVRAQPMWWFNFQPLNPVAVTDFSGAGATSTAGRGRNRA